MKAKELAKRLLKCPDVEVMFQDPNSNGGPFSITAVTFRTAEKDEFPDDFCMPKAFKFIELTN